MGPPDDYGHQLSSEDRRTIGVGYMAGFAAALLLLTAAIVWQWQTPKMPRPADGQAGQVQIPGR